MQDGAAELRPVRRELLIEMLQGFLVSEPSDENENGFDVVEEAFSRWQGACLDDVAMLDQLQIVRAQLSLYRVKTSQCQRAIEALKAQLNSRGD